MEAPTRPAHNRVHASQHEWVLRLLSFSIDDFEDGDAAETAARQPEDAGADR
jgi:hypothetical protein